MLDPVLKPHQHIGKPADIGQPAGRILPGRAQQHVTRLVAAQHVVNDIIVEGHLPPGPVRPHDVLIDQPADHRAAPEGALEQRAFIHPRLQIVAKHVLIEQLSHRLGRLRHPQRPGRDAIVRGDKPQRRVAKALQPLGQQHAQRLVCVPSLEAVGNQIHAIPAREGLDQQPVGAGQARLRRLQLQPLAHRVGQARPTGRVFEHDPHPVGQVGRQRHAPTAVGRHRRVAHALVRRAADQAGLVDLDKLQQPPGENEGIPGSQPIGEELLDLPQRSPETIPQPHLQRRRLDDGADVHAVAAGVVTVGDPPPPVAQGQQALIALVGAQGVTAIGDKPERVVEVLPAQVAEGPRPDHLGVEIVGLEGPGAGHADDVLGQNIQPPGPGRVTVELLGPDPVHAGLTLQHLEAVGRNQHGTAGLVKAVVGPADALHQAADPLGRADLHHQIHVAPVDPQIQR